MLYRSILSILFATALTVGVSSCASQSTNPALIEEAIANPERIDSHKERDARSNPAVVLKLLNLQPDDTAVDIFGGGGYYADLMAGIVGPNGKVILQNNKPYLKWVKKEVQERYIDATVPGVEALVSEVDDLQLPSGINSVLMVMSFHDLFFVDAKRGWGNTDIKDFLNQLNTAMVPGARLVIIDHAAEAGTGSAAVQKLHRIDENFVKTTITDSGFSFVESNDSLRNPNDDKSKMVFAKDVRGKTDRFILVFAKQ